MSSYGTSPSNATPLSLLIPPNPAFGSTESVPKGGILINVQRTSDAGSDVGSVRNGEGSAKSSRDGTGISPSPSNSTGTSRFFGGRHSRSGSTSSSTVGERRTSAPGSPTLSYSTIGATSPSSETFPSSILGSRPIPFQSSDRLSGGSTALNPPKIRFAPLPDPRRPRSLSTGRNIVTRSTLSGSNGDRTMAYEVRGGLESEDPEYDEGYAQDDDDEAVEDEEMGDDETEGGEERIGRSWSKTMSMGIGMGSWKETKKLLTGKSPKKELVNIGSGLSGGAPLTKSISTTSGFIGSAPNRWSIEQRRKESLLGPNPALGTRRQSNALSVSPSSSHRRNSSLEPSSTGGPSAFGTSPAPVRMLNGRVYGSRRQSEAAEREKLRREKEEPAFVEWGHGKAGGGLGSNAPVRSGGGFLGDDDDGGGMSWVRRRREERERKEREARERELRIQTEDLGGSSLESPVEGTGSSGGVAGLSSSQSTTDSSSDPIRLVDSTSPLTPALKISELPTTTPVIQVSSPVVLSSHIEPEITKRLTGTGGEHTVQAINIQPSHSSPQPTRGVDIFGTGSEPIALPHARLRSNSVDDEGEEEEDEEEEEDDGDFEEDPEDLEEEKLNETARTTSSAAGVEVVSRHKD